MPATGSLEWVITYARVQAHFCISRGHERRKLVTRVGNGPEKFRGRRMALISLSRGRQKAYSGRFRAFVRA